MAEVGINRDFERRAPTTVTATKARVVAWLYNYDLSLAVIEVEFIEAGGSAVGQEMWIAGGQPLANALQKVTPEGTPMGALDDALETIINNIENTEGRKQQLIDSGVLRVTRGSIMNGVRL